MAVKTVRCEDCGRPVVEATAQRMRGRCVHCWSKRSDEEYRKTQERLAAGVSAEEFDELCGSDDVDDSVRAVYVRAHARWSTLGEESLSTGERTVLAVEEFLVQLCRGGVYEFLATSAGALANEVPAALERAGLEDYLPAAQKMVSKFGGDIPREWDVRNARIEELFTSKGENALDDVNSAFDRAHGEHDPEEGEPHRGKVLEYVCGHREEFVRGA